MAKYSILSVLLCLMVAASNTFWVGCSPEAEKGSVVNNRPATKGPEAGTQNPVPVVEPAETQPGKISPAVETLEASPKSEIPIAEMNDENSGENTLQIEIILLSKLWKTYTKGPVRLTHENHVKGHKIGCNECHHVYEDGKNVWKEGMPVAKCETCHNEPTVKGERKLPPDDQKRNLKLAFHGNCRGCHKEMKKENPETNAPLKCSACHGKK